MKKSYKREKKNENLRVNHHFHGFFESFGDGVKSVIFIIDFKDKVNY